MKTKVYQSSYGPKGKQKLCSKFTIKFADHFGKPHKLASGFTKEKQAQHFAGKIDDLVSFRSMGKAPEPDLAKWVNNKMSPKMKARLLEMKILDADMFGEFHALLVKVAKEYCKKKPQCADCPLQNLPHSIEI